MRSGVFGHTALGDRATARESHRCRHLCFICRRELLSIFSSGYAFIRRNYRRRFKLWSSAARECRIAAALLPFLETDLGAEPHCIAYMSDASTKGYALHAAKLSEAEFHDLTIQALDVHLSQSAEAKSRMGAHERK